MEDRTEDRRADLQAERKACELFGRDPNTDPCYRRAKKRYLEAVEEADLLTRWAKIVLAGAVVGLAVYIAVNLIYELAYYVVQ